MAAAKTHGVNRTTDLIKLREKRAFSRLCASFSPQSPCPDSDFRFTKISLPVSRESEMLFASQITITEYHGNVKGL